MALRPKWGEKILQEQNKGLTDCLDKLFNIYTLASIKQVFKQ